MDRVASCIISLLLVLVDILSLLRRECFRSFYLLQGTYRSALSLQKENGLPLNPVLPEGLNIPKD